MKEPELTPEQQRIYSEYIISNKTYPNKTTQVVTLIPTYFGDLQHIKVNGTPNWVTYEIGKLVHLTRKNKIIPVKYDMRKCDTMLVTSVHDWTTKKGDIRQIAMMGKKFGIRYMDLAYDQEFEWMCKFYDIKRGDEVLVRPMQTLSNYLTYGNDYEILRNFTMEKRITEFFNSQKEH